MIIGNAAQGLSISFVFVPLFAEIIEAVKEKEGIKKDDDVEQLTDLASGFFNSSTAIGCLFAPILGGYFNDLYGFRYTCDIMAFSSLIFAFLYFFLNLIPYLVTRRQSKRIEI